jgi:hypothetical protein
MRLMVRVATSAAAVAVASVFISAQTPPVPTVDQVIEKYIAAVGGRAAIAKITSIRAVGALEVPDFQLKGTIELSQKTPNKSLQIVTFEGMGAQREGFDGTEGWAADPQNGTRVKTGAELADARRGAMFPRELTLKQQFPKLDVTGREKVGAREAVVMIGTPAEGSPVRMFFDGESGLLIRQIITRQGPEGPTQVDATYDDYRVVDGVKRAHTIRQTTAQFSATLRLSEVIHNIALDDAIFRKPGS